MSYPVIERREDDGSGTPGRMLSVVFPAHPVPARAWPCSPSRSTSATGAPWVFFGGIVAISLAFAIPTTILPALEDRLTVSVRRRHRRACAVAAPGGRLGRRRRRARHAATSRSTSRSGVTTGGPPIS